MCFRPPTASKPSKCPECGAANPPNAKTCRKCNADLIKTTDNSSSKNQG